MKHYRHILTDVNAELRKDLFLLRGCSVSVSVPVSVNPLRDIGEAIRRLRLWLHF